MRIVLRVLLSLGQYSTVQYSTVQYSTVQYSTQYSTVQYRSTQCDQYKWRRWQWSVAMGVSAPLRQAAAANVCQIRSFTFSAPFLFDSDIWESEGGSEPPPGPHISYADVCSHLIN